MLFIVIEKFRDGDPKPVYRRFREKGRMAPKGVRNDRYLAAPLEPTLITRPVSRQQE